MSIRRLLTSSGSGMASSDFELIETARRIAAGRRLRRENFPESLFGETGWDILLTLYSASPGERQNAAALAALLQAPPTATVRWVDHLEEQGFVLREHDHPERFLATLHLTAKAQKALRAYLSRIARGWRMNETGFEMFERRWPGKTADNSQ
ncbi:MAG: MarR family transcriptional regulator [Sphingomicrobium sp.]